MQRGKVRDGSSSRATATAARDGSGNPREVVWELRPGGMLVQKRGTTGAGTAASTSHNSNISSSGTGGPVVRVRVSYGSYQHELCVPAYSTFGELKRMLAPDTGLEPHQQRLLFKGKDKDDHERLHMAGVRDDAGPARLVLMEDPASKERRMRVMEEADQAAASSRASEAVAGVRVEVDKLAGKVSSLERTVNKGTRVADKDLAVLIELLMMQLLKLDAIEARGDARLQRRYEVRRIQGIVDTLDALKAKNSSPFIGVASAVPVTTTTKREAF